jgi:KDO2-lipid IV(A) lauroyltransferase
VWVRYSPPLFGLAFGLALASERRLVRENLRRVCGTRGFVEEQWDALKTFATYASCLAESLGAERADAAEPSFRVIGNQHFQDALGAGRGLIIVTAHVGPWDVIGRTVSKAATGRRVLIAMSAEADTAARMLHDAIRERAGTRIVHVGTHALDAMPLLKHLRTGGIVAMQMDRSPRGARTVEVSLFGAPFRVPEGPFRLAGLAGAAILPVFARRIGYFEYELTIRPSVEVSARPGAHELSAAAQQIACAMEQFICACPTQWFHFNAK